MGKPNAYSIFVNEQRSLNRDWKNKSNQELFVLADPLWRSLSEEERSRYQRQAKELRNADIASIAAELNNNETNGHKVGGLDHIGRPLSFIEERDKKLRESAENKSILVKKIVDVGNNNDTVEYMEFFLIHVNIFVKTVETGVIVPAEIAVTKFSIINGVIETYQAFIKPGDIPSGYRFKCVEASETKHKIPLNYEREHRDLDATMTPEFTYTNDKQIMDDFKKMFEGATNGGYLFTLPEHEDNCSGVLKTIANRAGVPELDVKILPLPDLLYRLAGQFYVPTVAYAKDQFDRERFLYHNGLSCDWHESETDTSNCSEAHVLRWVYTILAFTNDIFDVEREDGKHVPLGVLEQDDDKEYKWEVNEKPSLKVNHGFTGDGQFASTDVRYRNVSVTDTESVTESTTNDGTNSEFVGTTVSDFDTDYDIQNSSSTSARSSLPPSSRASMSSSSGIAPGSRTKGVMLTSLRSSRLAANLK